MLRRSAMTCCTRRAFRLADSLQRNARGSAARSRRRGPSAGRIQRSGVSSKSFRTRDRIAEMPPACEDPDDAPSERRRRWAKCTGRSVLMPRIDRVAGRADDRHLAFDGWRLTRTSSASCEALPRAPCSRYRARDVGRPYPAVTPTSRLIEARGRGSAPVSHRNIGCGRAGKASTIRRPRPAYCAHRCGGAAMAFRGWS